MRSQQTSARPLADAAPQQSSIRTRECRVCPVCSSSGVPLFTGLRDRLFSAPGEWRLVKCADNDCGLVWLNPMPLAEDLPKAYEEYLTHDVPASAPFSTLSGRLKLGYLSARYGYNGAGTMYRALGRLLGLVPSLSAYFDFGVAGLRPVAQGRLLDIGCGAGTLMQSMRQLGWNVEGLDFDPVVVRQAQARGLKVVYATPDDTGFSADSFDAIVMSHVIEHVPDPAAVVAECARILKPGGRLAIFTPNAASWGARTYRENWLYWDPPRHLHLFTPDSLARIVTDAGLAVEHLRTSARTSAGMAKGSEEIRRTGHADVVPAPGLKARLARELYEMRRWAAVKCNPDSGEEIMMMGRKTK